MNTVVKDWQIVSVYDGTTYIGDVLYAIVVDDMTCRFCKGDYVTTSKIIKLDLTTNLLTTSSGSLYQLLGEGSNAHIDSADFELLRHGFTPESIAELNSNSFLTH